MNNSDRIIRMKTVLARTGLSRSTLYRKIADGLCRVSFLSASTVRDGGSPPSIAGLLIQRPTGRTGPSDAHDRRALAASGEGTAKYQAACFFAFPNLPVITFCPLRRKSRWSDQCCIIRTRSSQTRRAYRGGPRYHQTYHQHASIRWSETAPYGISIPRKTAENPPFPALPETLWERILVTPTAR
jgi:hypothetical protein